MIEQVTSRYRVLRELGRGGMGVVYVVEHVHTGERLALKVLNASGASDPEVLTRFRREARAGAQIRSEHVVRVTDADVADELGGAPFFVMELLEGLDFEKLVGKVGPLRSDLVTDLLSQVAKALDKAHAIGIVHRDLKPENLFLHFREGDTPIAKILDFGISKFLHPTSPDQGGIQTTRDGMLMGTPYYMSPEQARGDVDAIGPATDVWAMGLVALRLLTAQDYWTARTQADLMVQLLAAPMRKPSERWPFLGDRFDLWFARSCHRDPSERWNTIGDQIAALGEAVAGRSAANATAMPAVIELLQPADRIAAASARRGSARAIAPESAPRKSTITAVPAAPAGPSAPTPTAELSAQTNLVHTARAEVRARGGRRWPGVAAASMLAVVAAAFVGQWVVRKNDSSGQAKSAAPSSTAIGAGGATGLPIPIPPAPATVVPAPTQTNEPIPMLSAKSKTPTPRLASSGRTAPRPASSAVRVQHETPTPSAQPAPPPVRTVTPDDDIMRP
jgi:serine/threonine-protein kinase